jgi:vancomycin permeability regulator SanA
MAKRVRYGCIALLAAALTLLVCMLWDGLVDDAAASDVAIVLGSKVMTDGTPSARLKARLDKAAELFQRGLARQVIVSGGIGKEGFSEAKVMADYLVGQLKLPAQAVLLDEHGNTTRDTAKNSLALMQARGLTSATVVTQYFHITRSRLALRQAGVSTVRTAHPDFFELRDLYALAREAVALPMYWAWPH